MKRLIPTAMLGMVVAIGLAGCTTTPETPTIYPVEEIEPRPDLDSVPDDAAFVAQMSGPGGFRYDLSRGQRYYLVDLDADRVINSGKALEGGTLRVGTEGATLEGRQLWEADAIDATRIGLFVATKPERQ